MEYGNTSATSEVSKQNLNFVSIVIDYDSCEIFTDTIICPHKVFDNKIKYKKPLKYL